MRLSRTLHLWDLSTCYHTFDKKFMKIRQLIIIILGLAALIIMVLILKFYYNNNPENSKVMPKCIFYTATGYKCPGCGGQRALHYLLKGEIKKSFLQNPLLYLMTGYVFLLIILKIKLIEEIFPKLSKQITGIYACSFLLITIIAFWILRNVFDF